jgi:hypothetical protein
LAKGAQVEATDHMVGETQLQTPKAEALEEQEAVKEQEGSSSEEGPVGGRPAATDQLHVT